jgi:DNA-binding MarR family transcriptional regulator
MRASDQGISESVAGLAAVLSEMVASHLEGTLKKSGLTLSSFELLSAVKGSPSATQADLAAKLGITPSSFCESVRAASDRGLVEQESSDRDRRAKRVVLTRKGARALDEALAALEEAEDAATHGIAPSKLATAVEVLRSACRNLSRENARTS